MEFNLSWHAQQEIERRDIPLPLVETVLRAPEQTVPAFGGAVAWQSRLVFPDGRLYLLRVIVAERSTPPTVVTVYRTSKIAKYWRQG